MKYLLILLLCLPLVSFSQEQNYITNKEYNEFVTYVRDSSLRYTMGEEVDEEEFLNMVYDDDYKKWEIIGVNWKAKLDVNSPEAREALEPWYYEPDERLNRKRELDPRKFIHNGVKIYPDVMIWCRDSTINKSWATFLTKYYYIHSYFENYPVYGLSQQQINEYLKWKYPHQEKIYNLNNKKEINLTLPKEKSQFTVGEYFEFYQHTRDSITMSILGEEVYEDKYYEYTNEYGEEIDPPLLDWKAKIDWKDTTNLNALKKPIYSILNNENKIDNQKIIYTYSWIDYSVKKDRTKRYTFIRKEKINLYNKKYMPEFSPINIKKQLKNKTEIDYSSLTFEQLRAFYYWKQSKYNLELNSEFFIPNDNTLKLIQQRKFSENFKISIPVITVE